MTESAGPEPAFEKLLTYIKESRGFDFTGYKRASLLRRVHKRMQAVRDESYEDYLDRLQLEPGEFTTLFNTILINVTGFLRDPEAWSHLRSKLIPELVARKGNAPIRIWSAGCATGEEAYSLAICFAEAMGVDAFQQRVKIYATDVDEEALTQARLASYTEEQLGAVPSELAEKYFEISGKHRVFTKQLRRSVIFGRNNLVQDAPISHIDLLVCRNTLMYFDAETQGRILSRLHYALEPGGLLFLGKAELLLSHGRILTPVEGSRRFFRKVATDPVLDRALVLGISPPDVDADDAQESRVRREAMLSAPMAQIVVDAAGRLVLSNHRAETLFGLTPRNYCQAFADLDLSSSPVELRPLLDQVLRERRTVWVRDVEWARPSMATLWFDVQIVPLAGDDRGALGLTIIFNDITAARTLQRELEMLQSTNEELETTNEELQSTNEELETMNEELQSMNDELGSSNEQLRERAAQVNELNDFMESILASLKVGVAVVDQDLKVSAWNGSAQELWGVRPDEAIGEHLLNLDIGLPLDELKSLVRKRLAGRYDEHSAVVVEAVNRRGRPVNVQVTLSPLVSDGDGDGDGQQTVTGAILVMDEVSMDVGSAEPTASVTLHE